MRQTSMYVSTLESGNASCQTALRAWMNFKDTTVMDVPETTIYQIALNFVSHEMTPKGISPVVVTQVR